MTSAVTDTHTQTYRYIQTGSYADTSNTGRKMAFRTTHKQTHRHYTPVEDFYYWCTNKSINVIS